MRSDVGRLGMIALDNISDLAKKVDKHVVRLMKEKTNEFVPKEGYLIPTVAPRFANGEGKGVLNESVCGKDIFILSDIGNHYVTYDFYGEKRAMSPDEHVMDIVRVVGAIGGEADRINLVTPLLPYARQHRRKQRESLDCAIWQQIFEQIGIDNRITFDMHDPEMKNATPLHPIKNLYPTKDILTTFVNTEVNADFDNLIPVAPDNGAMGRATTYASMLGANEIAHFYKLRDYSRVVNGFNPIKEHRYTGNEKDGMSYVVVDDMIASGGSLIDCFKRLHEKNPKDVYAVCTFPIFTHGIEQFDKAYNDGLFTKIYTTNLTQLPGFITTRPWLQVVDCTESLAQAIFNVNQREPMSPLLNGKQETYEYLKEVIKINKQKVKTYQ